MKPEANLCNSLKQIRLRLGLSQQDLAAVELPLTLFQPNLQESVFYA